jgi:MoaA/NifB/PqqE/SkfB family radical SAM enzyme
MSGGFSAENFADAAGNRNPKRMIPFNKACEIIDDCAELGVKAMQFTGGGEPTVHPDHIAVFRAAVIAGLECGLVTNGTLLREGWDEVLPLFEWVRVSLDAGCADTYAKIRASRPETFTKVLSNIERIATKCPRALLGVGFVITPENWSELGEAARLVEATGASYLRVSAMFSDAFATPFEGLHDQIKAEIAAAKAKITSPSFSLVDLYGDRLADLRQHAPDYPLCAYQHFNCYIGGDQKVYRCCTTAYTTHGEVGDLRNQRFKDWFASSGPAYFNFDARSCHVCQFNDKNRAMNYLAGPKPLHVEFV